MCLCVTFSAVDRLSLVFFHVSPRKTVAHVSLRDLSRGEQSCLLNVLAFSDLQPFSVFVSHGLESCSSWQAGGSVSVGQAGRDRRVRARPGSQELDEVEGESELEEDKAQEALGPYTHPRQVSPDRKRGRVPTLGRTRLDSRLSLDAVLSSEPKKILQLCVDAGFLPAEPSEPCKCETPSWLVEERETCRQTGDARSAERASLPGRGRFLKPSFLCAV